MIVVDHQPNTSFQLRRADEYIMRLASGIGNQSLSVATRLDEEQLAAISLFGKAACQEIAPHLADHFMDAYEISECDEAEIHAAIDNLAARK